MGPVVYRKMGAAFITRVIAQVSGAQERASYFERGKMRAALHHHFVRRDRVLLRMITG